ncbi:MAG: transcriptional regulator PpsR [Pseudolabrys sp.]|nr:transcriptional regulator PpsR [Pseudolabrys sp.]
MTIHVTQPDVTLFLNLDGVIREATLSSALSEEGVQSWLGQPWPETVGDLGGEKIRRMVEDARATGMSAFRQVTQRFPSGLELPMEYTTVLLGGHAGLLAIGKSLQAVAELQSRLITAQQSMERDYWKLRDVETKYRLLFDASQEPAILLNASSLRITEANPAAVQAMGLGTQKSVAGRPFVTEIAAADREPFQAMLLRVREQGKAPGIVIHLGKEQKPWLVRCSLMSSEPNLVMMLQLTPGWTGHMPAVQQEAISIDDLIERLPDAFIVLDKSGIIRRANRAFLDLVEAGTKGSVVGENLTRWLWRPGADLNVLLANVERHGSVRMFTTTIQGERGTTTEVEISAAGNSETDLQYLGVVIRDIGRRIGRTTEDGNLRAELGAVAERIGKTPLRKLVKETVGLVERHYVQSALGLANDNRTVAAELLGLSRQSLYAKLNRYGLSGPADETEQSE